MQTAWEVARDAVQSVLLFLRSLVAVAKDPLAEGSIDYFEGQFPLEQWMPAEAWRRRFYRQSARGSAEVMLARRKAETPGRFSSRT